MRGLAVCGRRFAERERSRILGEVRTIDIDGIAVDCATVRGEAPTLDAAGADVLVRKTAFSCNYRDKALILSVAAKGPPERCFTFGSDFVGVVVEIGARVEGLQVGDRVIPDANYVEPPHPGTGTGIPTNRASREIEVLPSAQLLRVPEGVPDAAAAALTICGQTTYAMLRRLQPAPGDRVLLTAGCSNVALFCLAALRSHEVRVTALTTSPAHVERLHTAGADTVVVVSRRQEPLAGLAAHGPFDRVVDPFGDHYLPKVVPHMAMNARYVTCGVARQFPHVGPEDGDPALACDVVPLIMVRNLEILGNCLGSTADLQRALADVAAGRFDVPIDGVLEGTSADRFLARTFVDADRFGKVVYRYD